MIRKTKFRRGVDDLGYPAAGQQAMHRHGGFSALGLLLRRFFLLKKRHFAVDQRSSMVRTTTRCPDGAQPSIEAQPFCYPMCATATRPSSPSVNFLVTQRTFVNGIPTFRCWDRNRQAPGAGRFRRARLSRGLAASHRCLRPAAEFRPPPQHRYLGLTCKISPVWSPKTTDWPVRGHLEAEIGRRCLGRRATLRVVVGAGLAAMAHERIEINPEIM